MYAPPVRDWLRLVIWIALLIVVPIGLLTVRNERPTEFLPLIVASVWWVPFWIALAVFRRWRSRQSPPTSN
jgi:hypothetical protein